MNNPRLFKAKLSQSGVHCSLDWVTACLDWLAGDQPGLTTEQTLLKLQDQWTTTDINVPGVMDRPVLPPNLAGQTKVELPGQYSVQVQHGHDISLPAYSQLQKLHNVDQENARVSADDSQASQLGGGGYQVTQGRYAKSWEPPRPQRCLMLTLTDGVQTVEAMETEPVNCLPDVIMPGTKIQLLGPLMARKGIICLKNNNVRLLGGEVEELVEEFSLQKILQQKIGKEDVGQNLNRFAQVTVAQVNDNAPIPPPPVHQNRNLPQPAVRQNPAPNNLPQDPFEDEDDDILLLAASQAEDEMDQEMVFRSASASSASTSSVWDRDRGQASGRSWAPPVGVVEPLRTITNVSEKSQEKSCNKKIMAQSSITTFMTSRSSEPPDNRPSFSLMDSDDEFMADFQYEETFQPREVLAPSEPFQYLVSFNQRIRSSPEEIVTGRFKVVSSTLASKMKLDKSESGPQWNVQLILNDGTDSIKVDLSPVILDRKIGLAANFVQCRDPQQKVPYKQNILKFSKLLVSLNCIATIQYSGQPGQVARIIEMEDISGKHLAAMIKRSKSYRPQ